MPWLKDLKRFRRDPLDFYIERGNSASGSLARLDLGLKPVWLVTRAEIVKDILKASEDRIAKGRMIQKLRPIFGRSHLTLSGPEHHRRRQAMHATFAKGTAQHYVPEMAAVIRRQAAALAATQDEFSARDLTALLTLRMISIVMFGHNVLTPGDEQAMFRAVSLVEADMERELFEILPPAPWTLRARKKKRAEAAMLLDLLVRRVRARANASSALASLVALGLPDDAIRDEVVTMLVAGHHTTGSAAVWLLYHLATEPNLLSRISAEARNITGPDGELRPGELSQAPLSLNLVREVLRLYPSAHWFTREAMQPVVIDGTTIRKGETIIIAPWLLHRLDRYWDEPNTFRMGRSYGTPAYIPFGAGPRACLGMGIAMLNLQLLALEVASTFDIAVTSPVPAPPPVSSVALVPPDIRLKMQLRSDASDLVAAE